MHLYDEVNAAVEDFAVLFEFWKEGEGSEEDVRAAYDKALQGITTLTEAYSLRSSD